MKRITGLYPQIYEFANLSRAYKKARRGKRYRHEVLKYTANLEENLISLQNDLMQKTYKQGKHRVFTITEPKKRTIAALPFCDRVAQHALNFILEPIFDKRFYFHSYACREGKGTHRASEQLKRWIRNLSFEGKPLYALKADIKNYFATVEHGRLKEILRRTIKDKSVLWLCDHIIDNGSDTGRGIPVGNLTSQLFANIYLDVLDKYIKEDLRMRHYIRYMDDFVILSHDKRELAATLRDIEKVLNNVLDLQLNPKTVIINAKNGVDFCGYRHYKDHKKVRERSIRNMRRKIKAYQRGRISKDHYIKSIKSWWGHVQHADSYALRRRMLKRIKGES